MNVLLINPKSTDRRLNSYPMGLAYIHTALTEAGHHPIILDLNFESEEKELYSQFAVEEMFLVGITTCSENIYDILQIAKKIKLLYPKAIVILGGPHATFEYEKILYENHEIDIISVGEGEETFVALANMGRHYETDNLRSVKGIAFRENDSIIYTGEPIFCENKKRFPFREPDMMIHDSKGRIAATLCTSRGCPHKCSFCALNVRQGKRWLPYAVNNIKDELDQLVNDYNVKVIDIQDADFFCSHEHALNVSKLVISKSEIERVYISCRIDSVLKCKDILKMLLEHVELILEVGIEGYSNAQLKRYNKKISTATINEGIDFLNTLKKTKNIEINLDLILFDPYVELHEIKDTVHFLIRNNFATSKQESELFSYIRLLPGTEMKKVVIKDGLTSGQGEAVPYWKFQNPEVALIYSNLIRFRIMHMEDIIRARKLVSGIITQALTNSCMLQAVRLKTDLDELEIILYEYLLDLIVAVEEGLNVELVFQNYSKRVVTILNKFTTETECVKYE